MEISPETSTDSKPAHAMNVPSILLTPSGMVMVLIDTHPGNTGPRYVTVDGRITSPRLGHPENPPSILVTPSSMVTSTSEMQFEKASPSVLIDDGTVTSVNAHWENVSSPRVVSPDPKDT